MGGDALQNISEPDERVDAMQLAGAHQRVKHGTSFCCFVAAGKQIIFSPKSYRPYGVFYRVVIYVQFTISCIQHEFPPSGDAIT